jgi:hypothetical protein
MTKRTGISLQQEREWLGTTARRVQRVVRRLTSTDYLIVVPVETDSQSGGSSAQFAHSTADTAVVFQLSLDDNLVSSAREMSYWVSAPKQEIVRNLAASATGIFPKCYVDRHLDDRARPPHDTLVLDLRSRGYSHFGVSLAHAPRYDHPANRLLVTDIAYFFHQCAKLLAGSHVKLPGQYAADLPFRLLHPPSQAGIVSEYACPECNARRKSYERDCLECGWGASASSRPGRSVSPYEYELADT